MNVTCTSQSESESEGTVKDRSRRTKGSVVTYLGPRRRGRWGHNWAFGTDPFRIRIEVGGTTPSSPLGGPDAPPDGGLAGISADVPIGLLDAQQTPIVVAPQTGPVPMQAPDSPPTGGNPLGGPDPVP
jgi:hypothetical protein